MSNSNLTKAGTMPDIKIDEKGFVMPSKAISLQGISLGIWVATLVVYRALVSVKLCPEYTAFCFFTSLALSVAGSWFVVNKMKIHVNGSSKIFLVLMNSFVIYTSANGIQAGNAFLTKSDPGDICKKASFIPFLPSAPWLPDKDSRETIAAQETSLNNLRDSLNVLNRQYNDLIIAQNTSGGIVNVLVSRTDSLQKLLDIADQKNRLWDSLKIVWANAVDRSVSSIRYNYPIEGDAPRMSKRIVSIFTDSTAGGGFYKQLFGQ